MFDTGTAGVRSQKDTQNPGKYEYKADAVREDAFCAFPSKQS